jgi:Pvc16 N-terminal domain
MSDPLAISAVSAVLQFYLYNLYKSPAVAPAFAGTVTVSAQAPDLVQNGFGVNMRPENQVNLFLHQVTYNTAWRNAGLPSMASDGKTRLSSPPLGLDLHYLLTAYGSADWQAEGLLGYALMMFHENSIITRHDISYALSNLTGTNTEMISALKFSTLADQVEMIKITPATLGREEMAWLWTALKADYRPTFPFQVSVVLIQPKRNTRIALPVLSRGVSAVPIQPAQILEVQYPYNPYPIRQAVAAFSDTVTIAGEFLRGASQVSLGNPRYSLLFPIVLPAAQVTATSVQFVPNTQTTYPAGVPPGIYDGVVQFPDPSDPAGKRVGQSTNSLPVALAPTVADQAQTATLNADGTYTVSVNFTPNVWEGQTVSLSLSGTQPPVPPATLFSATAPAQPFTGNSNATLKFIFPSTLPAGPLLGRLTVDGVTNVLKVDGTTTPPTFKGPMVTITL